MRWAADGKEVKFLSTLSLRRATGVLTNTCFLSQFLSTLSLRRATAAGLTPTPQLDGISIHALLAESDCRQPALQRTA